MDDRARNGDLSELLRHDGDRPALRAPEDNAAVSYGELAETVGALAGRLASFGVVQGDCVRARALARA